MHAPDRTPGQSPAPVQGPAPEQPGQFRLDRIQLVNWGTFSGYSDISVPRRGVLVTGASGSGKSSLLDAIAAVMVQPRWLAFNAAAQQNGQGDRSRSILSYVRGAHRRDVDEATGQVTTAYLRSGATWSGIALTFDDAAGRLVTLMRLMHAPASAAGPADVKSLYVDTDGPVELRSAEPLVANGLDIRRINAAHPTWSTTKKYSGFATRLQRRLGLASDQAQRLLHKTQSAKNLSSLNTLLRDFMLDEPETFELADQAVEQFEELSGAHRSVVDARNQVASLEPLEPVAAAYRGAVEQLAGLDDEQHHAETFFTGLRADIAERLIADVNRTLEGLHTEITGAQRAEEAATAAREQCQARIAGLGGDRIPYLRTLLDEHRATASKRRNALADATRLADGCGLELPTAPAGWDGWDRLLAGALDRLDAEEAVGRDTRYDVQKRHFRARDARDGLADQLKVLEQAHSNMEAALLAARDTLADRLGVEAAKLPFAGELIDVDPDESRWQGAVERVLRPLARTLLVPDQLYAQAAAAVDRQDWGTRLVWERATVGSPVLPDDADPNTLPGKITVSSDSPFAGWLTETIRRRYDYRCVEDASEFTRHDRALTLAGQVKHSHSRHEKDDRWPVGDRTRWLLGSSTASKQEALRTALQAADAELRTARAAADEQDDETRRRSDRRHDLESLRRLEPGDIDVDEVAAKIAALDDELAQLLAGNQELSAAESDLESRKSAETAAHEQTLKLRVEEGQKQQRLASLTRSRDGWTTALTRAQQVPAAVQRRLEKRIAAPQMRRGADGDDARLDLDDIAEVERWAVETIGEDQRTAQGERDRQIRRAEGYMRDFKTNWPQRAADLQIGIEYLDEYLAQLGRLRDDRLPDFENRFFELLQSQSRNNITVLSSRIRASRREIRNRIDPINESLMRTEYSEGTHLQVRVITQMRPEVQEFLRELAEITEDSVSAVMDADDDAESRHRAEERFTHIARLMARLRSQDPADLAWRRNCLDTRSHVEFRAEVIDADGRAVDFYEDAGGRSGGERQKFVTFCLAAALRYQLARDGATVPQYGLVALDEAFDKTDPEFTRAGLEVFRSFGFQLLLATPMKMLQTLEDYVGGVILFQNEPGRPSRILARSFDDEDGGARAGAADQAPDAQDALL